MQEMEKKYCLVPLLLPLASRTATSRHSIFSESLFDFPSRPLGVSRCCCECRNGISFVCAPGTIHSMANHSVPKIPSDVLDTLVSGPQMGWLTLSFRRNVNFLINSVRCFCSDRKKENCMVMSYGDKMALQGCLDTSMIVWRSLWCSHRFVQLGLWEQSDAIGAVQRNPIFLMLSYAEWK